MTHADHVSMGYAAHGMEGGDVAWREDQGREHAAMSFRIGRVYEAQQGHIAGAVSVDGGGLWTELEHFTPEGAGTFAFYHATGPVLACIASSGEAD